MQRPARRLFDEDHEAFRDSVQRFLADHVVPQLEQWRTVGQVPSGLFAAAGAEGLLGTAVPEELGGGGSDDPRFSAVLVEETARVGATGLALLLAVHSGVCLPLLLQHGTEEQRREWVPRLASGEVLGVVLDAGGPPLQTRSSEGGTTVDAVVDGVAGGSTAGLLVAAVVVDETTRLVLLDADGDAVVAHPVEASLAARDVGQADLVLAGPLTDADVLPQQDDPRGRVSRDLDLWVALVAVTAARAVLGMTLDYVRERSVFGRPLADFENTRHTLARVSAEVSSAGVVVDDAFERCLHGDLTAQGAAVARLAAMTAHDRAADEGMQLHGGYGYMREYPISHAFADARYLRNHAAAGTVALEAVAAALGI